jgi:hypothetical protein
MTCSTLSPEPDTRNSVTVMIEMAKDLYNFTKIFIHIYFLPVLKKKKKIEPIAVNDLSESFTKAMAVMQKQ